VFFQFNSIIILAIIKQKAKAFDCKDDRDTFVGLSPNSATKGHGSYFYMVKNVNTDLHKSYRT